MTEPLLAICIPTHEGRGRFLRETLESILSQMGDVPAGSVTISISDNASQDETQAIVTELAAAHPGLITYTRQKVNLGFIPNMLQAMENACGTFGWLLSSDDRIAPGGLRRVWDALGKDLDTAGLTVRFLAYDRTMARLQEPLPLRLYPAQRENAHCYHSLEEAFQECGSLMGYISGQIYRRTLWASALTRLGRARVLAAGYFPYVLLAGEMLRSQPCWRWLPEPVVENRLDNDSVTQDLQRNIMRYQTTVLTDITAVWAYFLGTHSPVYRKLLRDNLATTWRWRAICSYKSASRCSLWDEVLALVGFTRRLYILPSYWWTTFPVLLIPRGLLRLLSVAARGRTTPSVETDALAAEAP